MDEPVGAQYAVQIAVATLKERCKNLQKRVDELEEENLSLKVQSSKSQQQLDSKSLASETEINHLRELLTKCMEKYQQEKTIEYGGDQRKAQVSIRPQTDVMMSNKMKMVQLENRDLWHRLSNHQPIISGQQQTDNPTTTAHLTDTKLVSNKSNNDSYSVHQQMSPPTSPQKDQEKQPLIRSRTFTQDESHDVTRILHRNVAEQTRICSQLEQISLEIRESFTKGKNELDSLFDDILDEKNYMAVTNVTGDRNNDVFSESLGFYYEDVDNNLLMNFHAVVEELLNTRDVVVTQKEMLQVALTKLADFQEILKKVDCRSLDSKNKKLMLDKTTFIAPNELPTSSESPATTTCDKNTSTAVGVETRQDTAFLRQKSSLSAGNNINTNSNNNNNNIRPEEPPSVAGQMCPVCSKLFYAGLEQLQLHVEAHFTDDINVNTFELL